MQTGARARFNIDCGQLNSNKSITYNYVYIYLFFSRLSHSDRIMMRSSGSVQKTPSPNSAAYRKQFMTRRHSSGTSDTPITREHLDATAHHATTSTANPLKSLSAYGSYPLVAPLDERRWSIANAECRRPSVLFVSGNAFIIIREQY